MNITLTEEWRPITVANFGDSYEVSNLGRVRSIDRVIIDQNGRLIRRQQQIIRPAHSGSAKRKYLGVVLSNGERTRFLVHRLVAMAFIPNPLGLPEVNHIDAIKDNNAVGNLEWCTQAHNMMHAIKLGLRPPPPDQTKISDDDVADMRRLFDKGARQCDLARKFGVSPMLVSIIVRNLHRQVTPVPPARNR